MDKYIISNKGKPPKRLRLTGRDGPARPNYSGGLARLCHSGGPPGLALKIRGFPALLARSNPVKYKDIKILDIENRNTQNCRIIYLQYFVIYAKNKVTPISKEEFQGVFTHFQNEKLQLTRGSSNPENKSFVLQMSERILP